MSQGSVWTLSTDSPLGPPKLLPPGRCPYMSTFSMPAIDQIYLTMNGKKKLTNLLLLLRRLYSRSPHWPSSMFLTWHFSANFQLARRDPYWSCLYAASPNQAHTHLAPFRGTVHCVHIALACRIQVQIGVQIEAATPFPHRSSPVQAALRSHSSSIFKLFSTLHLNKIRRLCSLNMHMINILRLIDFMRTNPNPRRSSCSLPLLINMLSMPESNENSASTPPYSSRAPAALQARSHPQVSLN